MAQLSPRNPREMRIGMAVPGTHVLVPSRDSLCRLDDAPVAEVPRARPGAVKLCEAPSVVDDAHKRLLPAHAPGPDDAVLRIAALCGRITGLKDKWNPKEERTICKCHWTIAVIVMLDWHHALLHMGHRRGKNRRGGRVECPPRPAHPSGKT